jgi:uncharacterized membrane protein YsdA (DUF1294 family)
MLVIAAILWLTANLFTFATLMYDKQLANNMTKKRRVSERAILFLVVLGGGLAAFLAIYGLKHKTGHKFRNKVITGIIGNAILLAAILTTVYVF